MRAHLLSTLCPALVLLVAACGPSDTASDTASDAAAPTESAAAPTTPPASPPPPAAAPAPTQTAAAPPAAAAAPDAEDPNLAAVALRQAPMKLLSYNFGPMRGMMQGNAPFDAAVVQTNTTRMAAIAGMIPGVFVTDTSSATGLDTTALPAVWTNKADFDMKAAALAEAATAAATAAAGGDQDATMAAVGAIGMACSGCHDDFRSQ